MNSLARASIALNLTGAFIATLESIDTRSLTHLGWIPKPLILTSLALSSLALIWLVGRRHPLTLPTYAIVGLSAALAIGKTTSLTALLAALAWVASVEFYLAQARLNAGSDGSILSRPYLRASLLPSILVALAAFASFTAFPIMKNILPPSVGRSLDIQSTYAPAIIALTLILATLLLYPFLPKSTDLEVQTA